MSARDLVLASLVLLTSACGSELTDPAVTLSPTDATLVKQGATWFFVSPVQLSYGSGSMDTRFAARVKERSGGFLRSRVSTPVFFSETRPKLEIPLDAAPVFPVGTEVVLTLEAVALNWDGATDHGITIRTQDYRFIMR